jgi:hypothetical protein
MAGDLSSPGAVKIVTRGDGIRAVALFGVA